MTKEERKQYMKQYMKQYNKEYYAKHKEERKEYSKEYYIKHKEERERKKKSKSTTYYVLKTPGKKDLKFKKPKDASLYSYLHHNDYPTYSIYRINIVTTEELVKSGENEVGEDDTIQTLYKMEANK